MTEKTLDPCGSDSSTELGLLPPYKYGEECGKLERVWTERDMHAFAAQRVAAERERCARLLYALAKECTGINTRLALRHAAVELRIEQPNTEAMRHAAKDER